MAENLFQGLPPPSVAAEQPSTSTKRDSSPSPAPATAPVTALKSALKRDKPLEPAPVPALKSALKRDKAPQPQDEEAPQKRIRFKTTVDATEAQIIDAMQKITSHIKNPSKFSKASKLALQLIQAGSVKPETSDYFFAILEAAMSSPSACTNASLRADYQVLFSAVQDVAECFSKQQRNQLATWTIIAVVANDLYTDDSFMVLGQAERERTCKRTEWAWRRVEPVNTYSKAAGKIKEAIASLPSATRDDDEDEAAALAKAEHEQDATSLVPNNETSDPFELDALLPSTSKEEKRARGKEVATLNKQAEEVESKRFVRSQREALLSCLEIAGRRYKIPWAQTVVDILVKYAIDNKDRFTSRQRDAIEKLWASISEQQARRKQGKSVTGKLDMNAFEFLQEKYANEKISIRKAVGGGGERRAQQWLG